MYTAWICAFAAPSAVFGVAFNFGCGLVVGYCLVIAKAINAVIAMLVSFINCFACNNIDECKMESLARMFLVKRSKDVYWS